jgi:hypothetical protein
MATRESHDLMEGWIIAQKEEAEKVVMQFVSTYLNLSQVVRGRERMVVKIKKPTELQGVVSRHLIEKCLTTRVFLTDTGFIYF